MGWSIGTDLKLAGIRMKNVVVLISVSALALALGYGLRGFQSSFIRSAASNYVVVNPSPTAEQQKVAPVSEITLVNQFELFQQQTNAAGVMSLFTPTESPKEKKDYEFLVGMDLVKPGFLRLYGTSGLTYKLASYKILSTNRSSTGDVSVEVEETREGYDNSTVSWVEEKPTIYVFEIEQVGPNNFIANYYPKAGAREKYGGLLN